MVGIFQYKARVDPLGFLPRSYPMHAEQISSIPPKSIFIIEFFICLCQGAPLMIGETSIVPLSSRARTWSVMDPAAILASPLQQD